MQWEVGPGRGAPVWLTVIGGGFLEFHKCLEREGLMDGGCNADNRAIGISIGVAEIARDGSKFDR